MDKHTVTVLTKVLLSLVDAASESMVPANLRDQILRAATVMPWYRAGVLEDRLIGKSSDPTVAAMFSSLYIVPEGEPCQLIGSFPNLKLANALASLVSITPELFGVVRLLVEAASTYQDVFSLKEKTPDQLQRESAGLVAHYFPIHHWQKQVMECGLKSGYWEWAHAQVQAANRNPEWYILFHEDTHRLEAEAEATTKFLIGSFTL